MTQKLTRNVRETSLFGLFNYVSIVITCTFWCWGIYGNLGCPPRALFSFFIHEGCQPYAHRPTSLSSRPIIYKSSGWSTSVCRFTWKKRCFFFFDDLISGDADINTQKPLYFIIFVGITQDHSPSIIKTTLLMWAWRSVCNTSGPGD